MGATVPSQPPDACLPIPAEDVSLQNCAAIDLSNAGGLSQTLQGYSSDTGPVLDLTTIPPAPDRASHDADVMSAKPWIRGPEPPAALLAVSGFAWIGLLIRRRRRPGARHRSRRRRLVYTIRQMA
jgi:hypothetical protein